MNFGKIKIKKSRIRGIFMRLLVSDYRKIFIEFQGVFRNFKRVQRCKIHISMNFQVCILFIANFKNTFRFFLQKIARKTLR